MDKHHIYIFTHGRVGKQRTLDNLHPDLREKTTLIIRKDEEGLHPHNREFCLPTDMRLSEARQYVLNNTHYKYITMLDDDLDWSRRQDGSLPNAKHWQHEFSLDLFEEQERFLREGFIHCGVSAREGNNRIKEDYKDVDRMMRVLSYNTEVVNKEGCRFDRLMLKADFDMTLQLLRLGYPNRVSYRLAQGQGRSNDPGGCSEYRTSDMNDKVCEELENLHPDFVRTEMKFTVSSWKNEFNYWRMDVVIQWKKAYQEGVENYGQRNV